MSRKRSAIKNNKNNKENKNTEDLDDYYMISNLFDEHLSNQINLPLTTISTNLGITGTGVQSKFR